MNDFNSSALIHSRRNKPVIQIIRDLKVGESYSWSLEKRASIRRSAYIVALQLNRKYKTLTDVENEVLKVIRLA